ncbi:protein kinase [Planctomycetaceae bacterium]|nr:protein kinase [Planctomycetaceae bacterium]
MALNPGDSIGRFCISAEIGSGGMGTVYRAFDERLQRDVAIKVLNEKAVADESTLSRFRREAKAVAGLSHANIVALYDFIEEDGVSFAVMELLEGNTLDVHLGNEEIGDERFREIATSVVRGLAAAHRSGVVHRDIKPSNIFLTDDDQVKLLDFGLATARSASIGDDGQTVIADELETGIGTVMGTVGYMSPEQVRGDVSDQRSDIFSLGAVFFEMVTGQRAFDRDTAVETMTAILNEPVPDASQVQLPRSHPMFEIIEKCLAKDREDRFDDAESLLGAIEEMTPTGGAGESVGGMRWGGRIVAVAVVLVAVAGFSIANLMVGSSDQASNTVGKAGDEQTPGGATSESTQATREDVLPRLLNLAKRGQDLEAYQLAGTVKDSLRDDAVFQAVWQDITAALTITTEPTGARVVMRDYDEEMDLTRDVGTTPIKEIRVSKSAKVLEISLEGFRPRVIAGEIDVIARATSQPIVLDSVEDLPESMVRVSGGNGFPVTGMGFALPKDPELAPSNVKSFLMDRFEVTNREYQEFVKSDGYTDLKHWTDPIVREGQPVAFEESRKLFVDDTGRPGPSTWEVGRYPEGEDDFPVRGVSWFEARAYARFVGKELPTVYHWSRATPTAFTGGWLGSLIQHSNIETNTFARVGEYKGLSPDGVYDLCGNVAEWVFNSVGPQKLSLGGSALERAYFFNHANAVDPLDRGPQRGFRCVKYSREAPPTALQRADVKLEIRDYEKISTVSDEVFAVYRNQFRYDETPLNPKVVYRKTEEYTDYVKERVEIDAAYGEERIIVYLYLPKNAKPPFQTLVYFRNAGSIRPVSSEKNAHEPYPAIMQSGRAVIHPVVKGTFERWDGLETWTSRPQQSYTEFLQKWVKDYLRTVDYAVSREDIDPERIGYLGDSWGAFNGLIIPAIEPRLKLSICYVGGLSMQAAPVEVDQASFIARVKLPVLWLSGKYDPIFPLTQSAEPAFRHLGTPPEHKRHVVYPSGHALPRKERIRETLDWLDKYFGVVR